MSAIMIGHKNTNAKSIRPTLKVSSLSKLFPIIVKFSLLFSFFLLFLLPYESIIERRGRVRTRKTNYAVGSENCNDANFQVVP